MKQTIYSNKYNSIISFNLIEDKKMNVIKNAHNNYIINFRHFLQDNKNSKRDLIISISSDDNNIKVWNVNNFECLINLKNINTIGYIFSAILFNDNKYNSNNYNYIITTNNWGEEEYCEPIKIFDMKGNKVKEIKNSNIDTYFIDSYYDKNVINIFLLQVIGDM